ncbi:MAG: FxsA family protein [Actinomycetota bacterium]|nr:FxsA family protein [Actinomycetota bacterium]
MLLALLLLICWPIAEVYVAIKVAGAIGVLYTVLALIAGWPIGVWVVRSQGAAAWCRLRAALAAQSTATAGRPMRAVLDGALVLLGGGLLIVPGFITDVIGICLLIPFSRAPLRAALGRRIPRPPARFTRDPRPDDVDATATDLDQPRLR